jgi:hypothetical protein
MVVFEAVAVADRSLSRQQRLYFFPLPQTQGSFRATVLDIVWLAKRFRGDGLVGKARPYVRARVPVVHVGGGLRRPRPHPPREIGRWTNSRQVGRQAEA